jgi:hypothetical protein
VSPAQQVSPAQHVALKVLWEARGCYACIYLSMIYLWLCISIDQINRLTLLFLVEQRCQLYGTSTIVHVRANTILSTPLHFTPDR